MSVVETQGAPDEPDNVEPSSPPAATTGRRRGLLIAALIVAVGAGGFAAGRTFQPAASTEVAPTSAPATTAPRVDAATVEGATGEVLRFSTAPIFGGGEQGAIAVGPDGLQIVVGADVSGVHVSTDGGTSFDAANEGRGGWGEMNLVSLEIDPRDPQVVWSASGVFGVSGGVHRSDDGGRTWRLVSDQPRFSGINNRDPGLPRPHPRSTGRLLAIDPTDGTLYAATFVDGLMRSVDDGATWTTIGFEGEHLRGLALDDTDPTRIYVASYESGLWRIDDARGAVRTAAVGGSPVPAEEVAVAGGVVFLAAGPAGVWRSDDGGASISPIGVGVLPSAPTQWAAIDAVDVGGEQRIVVGCVDPPDLGGGRFPCIFRSDDGGRSWVEISSFESASNQPPGSDRTWWIDQAQRSFMLGKRSFFVSQVVINPMDPSVIHLAARVGLWRSDDAGASWYPTVTGLGVTAHDDIAIAEDDPSRVYLATTDYRLAWTPDGFASVRGDRPRGSDTLSTDVELDPSTSPPTVLLAVGDRDLNERGEIYAATDPSDWDGGWSALGLEAATGGRRPLGMVVGFAANERILLAAVEGSGIWRRQGEGPWVLVDPEALSQPQEAANARFAWPDGDVVFLFDRASGVRRSLDAGRTWEMLLPIVSNTPSVIMTGFVAALDPSVLFVSAGDSLIRIDGANAPLMGDAVVTPLDGPVHPGAMAIGSDGSLWVADRAGPQTSGGPARLLVSTDRGGTWTDVADANYRARALNPASIAVGSDGRVVVATAQSGVLIADGQRAVP